MGEHGGAMAPAEVPKIASTVIQWTSRSRSSLPQAKAPCEPPPCSAVARQITSTRWNGWVFFGLKNHQRGVTKPVVRKLRCAVYTRKSSRRDFEPEFNSLHAQREACEAYVASQRSEGWVLVRDQYDDGGISGGTMERLSLQRLLSDIEEGFVDVVVVYKIDWLSRSLAGSQRPT